MRTNRITNIQTALLLVAAALLGPAYSAEQEMLATYAIEIEVRGSRSLIRGSKPTEFGKPITYEFGEYQIALLFSAKGSEEFTLEASLNSIVPSSNTVVSAITSETYTGYLSVPGNRSVAKYSLSETEIEIGIVLQVSVF